MKFTKLSIFFLLLFLSNCTLIQPAVGKSTVNLKTDFGAKGNGRTDDTPAFIRASAYINANRSNITLIIPAGNYLVGAQKSFSKKYYKKGVNLLSFSNCSNITIKCQNAKLKYKPNLKYGSFNPNTGQKYNPAKGVFAKTNFLAEVGFGVFMNGCNNVVIDGFDADGNSDNSIVGGRYGDKGIQAVYSGIGIYNSENVVVKNCKLINFGLDGIVIKTKHSNNTNSNQNILINNTICEYNGRMGLAWVGGKGITLKNSSFSHTGRGKITTSPGAGIDIEAEGTIIRNGKIINCDIVNNKGNGIVAESGDSKDIQVSDCLIWGTTSWSIWVRKANYTFTNCTIYGSTVHGSNKKPNEAGTKFINCNFRDTVNSYGKYLVNNYYHMNMLYKNCNFYAKTKKLAFIASAKADPSTMILLDNCSFYTDMSYKKREKDFLGIFRKVKMKNCKYYYNTNKAGVRKYYFVREGIVNLGGNESVYLPQAKNW